ncbi:MAG: GW dipeptide domain-containing protein [Melioribacteraceae bacterium]|nr:GW dipeptide domain-containing protein [Melioribacteraceae bacterium]MCO6473908.1 SH3-like domain-containing protein [Melioribacteraceae bacterium]MDD3558311.1 GW dipeptide domain-containing protein [Melioribacteraceae bacterium]
MKSVIGIITTLLIFLILFSACGEDSKDKTIENTKPTSTNVHACKVVEIEHTPDYTYLNVEENENTYWIAVPRLDIKEGENVYFSRFMEMKNFESSALKKTFESVLFVEDISFSPHLGNQSGMVMGDQSAETMHGRNVVSQVTNVEVQPLSDGKTISEIYEKGAELKGQKVKVRAKVTKFNRSIMDRNWVHLQDGTNFNGKFDLLATTLDETQVGAVVIVEGIVDKDVDFGAGYKYDIMLKDAKVTVETNL